MIKKGFTIIGMCLLTLGTSLANKPEKVLPLTKEVMPIEWYLKQAELWEKETELDQSNQDAWYNLYMANRLILHTAPESSNLDHSQLLKSLDVLLKRME